MVNGIAPNFIHGLDAALLSSTVLKLKADGCTNFHLIHDSYGVPINQVSNLNLRVREAYVELFKQQPLQQWIKQVNPAFEERGNDIMINTLDLEEVMDSRYIFS
jgi:DNA-directed RNA polymerase